MSIPNGLAEIIKKYGNPRKSNGTLSQTWYHNNITMVELPYTMRIAWDKSINVHYIPFHKLAAPALIKALTDAYNYARIEVKKVSPGQDTAFYNKATLEYLQNHHLDLFGGSFNFRKKRGSNSLSVHSWGVAFDIDPSHNPMGGKSTLPDWFVKIMHENGFKWGNDFGDPMHWQMATGY
jgi:hypothetical protein